MNLNSLDRRRFLRGTGVALALPLFECVASSWLQASEDPGPVRRLACIYFPDGVGMPLPQDPAYKDWAWFPHGNGTEFTFSKCGEPFEPLRNDLTILSGFSHPSSRKVHGHCNADQFLTAAATATSGPYHNSISLDQAGRAIGAIDPLAHRTTTTYDRADRPVAVRNAENEVTSTIYDNAGRSIASINPLSFRTTNTFDKANRQIAVTNAENERTTTVYDVGSRPIQVIDPLLNATQTVYDKADRPRRTVTPMGFIATTLYDAGGKVIAAIDPLNHRTTTTYDKANRPIRVKNAENEITTTVYDDAGRNIATINPLTFRTTTTYDKADRVRFLENAESELTETIYDAAGQPVEVVNPRGYSTFTDYDPDGRPFRTMDATFHVTTTIFDNASRAIETIDPRGNSTYTDYDDANRPTFVTNALLEVTETLYDDAGRTTGTIDADSQLSQIVYDKANRTIATVNELNHRTTMTYDLAGRQVAVTDPLGNTSRTVYDNDSRVTRQINPLNQATLFAYDAASRKTATTDGNGCTTSFEYDKVNRLTETHNPLGNTVTNIYDDAGRTIGVVNENGQLTETRYDKVDRRITTINPVGNRHTYSYDQAGNQSFRIDARNQVTTYVYDPNNRETKRLYADGTRATFAYDPAGNRKLMHDWTGRYTTTYDELNRVETTTDPGVPSLAIPPSELGYEYDMVGNRRRMYDPDGGIYTTLYDPAHQLKNVVNPGTEVTTLGYDAAGRNTFKALANGTTAAMSYDAAGNQERVLNQDSGSGTISDFHFGFDGVGNRTSMDEPGVQYSNWNNDATQQLTGDLYFDTWGWARLTLTQWNWFTESDWDALPVDVTGIHLRELVYDPAGNRLTQCDPATGDIVTNTYDDANRLQTSESPSGVTTYTYDGNGNTLTIEEPNNDITTNTWDCENRLVQVDHPDSTTTYYTYNADGLRVSKDDTAGGYTRMVYDGNNALREQDDTGLTVADITYDPQPFAHMISQFRDSVSSFYHFDGINNTSELTDNAGLVTDEYTLDAFGKTLSVTGSTSNPQVYKGLFRAYQTDPDAGIDSIFTLTRSFDVTQYRFLSEDPAEKDLNTYRLAGNNPVNVVDPSGRESGELVIPPQELDIFSSEEDKQAYVARTRREFANLNQRTVAELKSRLGEWQRILELRENDNESYSLPEVQFAQDWVDRIKSILEYRHGTDEDSPLSVKKRIWREQARIPDLLHDRRAVDELIHQHVWTTRGQREKLQVERERIEQELEAISQATGGTVVQDSQVRSWSIEAKFARAVELAVDSGKIGSEVAVRLREAIQPANLGKTFGMFAAIAALHAYNPTAGAVADAILIGYFGADTIIRAHNIYREVNSAQDEAGLQTAANTIIQEIAAEGSDRLIDLLTWGAGRTVAKLRTHPDESLGDMAKRFIDDERGELTPGNIGKRPPKANDPFDDVVVPKWTDIPGNSAKEIIDSLPPYVRGAAGIADNAHGILIVNGRAYKLASGGPNAAEGYSQQLAPRSIADTVTGFTSQNLDHVEGVASAILRKLVSQGEQINDVRLYINRSELCRGKAGCFANIRDMLPKGITVHIWGTIESSGRRTPIELGEFTGR